MSRKRICIVVQNYYDIDPRVRREAEALCSAGHTVEVIALRADNNPKPTYDLNGVQVLTIAVAKQRAGKWQYVWEYLSFFLQVALLLGKRMPSQRYDVVQVCTLPDFLVFATLLPRLFGARIVLDMHEVMPEFYMSKYDVPEQHWMIRLLHWQEWFSMKFAHHVLTINEPISNLLQSRGLPAYKVTVIMNSVDGRLFAAGAEAKSQHPQRANNRFVMMYHGTLTPLYGLDIALRGFASVQQRLDQAEFWIIGHGPEYEKLQLLAQQLGLQSKVRFVGAVPQQDIPSWLEQCDVGVLATRQDNFLDLSFSNKLPEYIVMGKPVICSRLKTIRHYFSEQALAFFTPHDIADLSNRMVELYVDKNKRLALVSHAQEEYKVIDWVIMKQRYVDVVTKD